jgi:ubiquinol oxidase
MTNTHDDSMMEDLQEVTPAIHIHQEQYRHAPKSFSDRVAKCIVHFSASCADFLFQNRYGHRAVVLETIAAVPGMVGGLLQHLRSLRHIRDDRGWIRALLDEAENERMHLLIYSEIAKPTLFERLGIMLIQFFFYHLYFVLYLISPATAHRVVGYFEEEAIHSYEHYLQLVKNGVHIDTPASTLAKNYWGLQEDSTLSSVIEATIRDEMVHRDVNHKFSDDKIGTNLWA